MGQESSHPPYRCLPRSGKAAARACTNMSAHASQTQTGTYRHVGLVARASTNTCTHASQTQARTQHKPPSWRLPGGLRLLLSGILGGSLFCSWTCPEQGSHTAVLDGSLFEKEQGGHTFVPRPHGAATIGGSNRSQRRRRPNTVHPARLMGPMVSVECCTGSPRRRRARPLHQHCRPRRYHLAPGRAPSWCLPGKPPASARSPWLSPRFLGKVPTAHGSK